MNDRPSRASTLTTAVIAHPGEDDVAVRDQDDDAHHVGALDRQQGLLSSLGRRANQSPRVKRAMGHDSIEGRDDLGVFEVDLRPVPPRLGHSQVRPGLGGVGLGLIDGGLGGQELGLGTQDLRRAGSLGRAGRREVARLLVGKQRASAARSATRPLTRAYCFSANSLPGRAAARDRIRPP